MSQWRKVARCLFIMVLSGMMAGAVEDGFSTPATLTDQETAEISLCLECHNDDTLSLTLGNGEELSLFIDGHKFSESVHGGRLVCTDCHSGLGEIPHPEGEMFQNSRQYALGRYESCKRCHFANYTKMLESVHYQLLSQGNEKAPVCVDCHGAHNITHPNKPRSRISLACAQCHSDIFQSYKQSVHGHALIEEGNADVPVCTDCHGTHRIADARLASFRLGTPELCGHCHKNATLMDKYGLSTNVVDTYLKDFHGMSTAIYSKQGNGNFSSYKALCTDCHGVHNITHTDNPNSMVMKANLVETCRRCHPQASENFPDAWLPHYEPSLQKAPLVFLVKLFYRIIIPFIIGGLILHIALHVWRVGINR